MEVQVVTNQFSSEYGRASGGRVNLHTRGGTRHLRGRLFYFFRDEALDANTFNNNRRGLWEVDGEPEPRIRTPTTLLY